jgi:hypothetical protein
MYFCKAMESLCQCSIKIKGLMERIGWTDHLKPIQLCNESKEVFVTGVMKDGAC